MSKRICVVSSWLFLVMLTLPAFGSPIIVQSLLLDSDADPLTVGPLIEDAAGNPVVNGDFTILRISTAVDLVVGNGIDDRTRGAFDFRSDPNYAAFSSVLSEPHGKPFSAQLSLVLRPFSLFANDQISIENLSFVGEPEIGQQLTDNPFIKDAAGNETMFKMITLDLLDYFSQVQLENFLSGGTGDFASDGQIAMVYSDDAIVSAAMLRLTANRVSMPGTLVLIMLGFLSSMAIGRMNQRR